MNPFSAWYYIKENKKRSILLIAMIFLSFGVYIGGLYVTNPYDNWIPHINTYKKVVSVGLNSDDDTQYQKFLEQMRNEGKVTVIELGIGNSILWDSIMGFTSGVCTFTFQTVEDFMLFCNRLDIECDFTDLKKGSMILSERFAKNKGLSIGDKVDKHYDNYSSSIVGEFVLDKITNEDSYTQYYIGGTEEESYQAILIGNGLEGDALYDYVYSVQRELDTPKDVFVYMGVEQDIAGQFEMFDLIYMFIALLFSIILAITINAAFVGMYQRREFEFSVYRAIGISKKRIIGKIAGELLLIDAIALAIGSAVSFVFLYLFNNLVLYPNGMYLRYFNSTALIYMVLCNVIIIVPLIITRCRQMLKTDVCEY